MSALGPGEEECSRASDLEVLGGQGAALAVGEDLSWLGAGQAHCAPGCHFTSAGS